MKYQNFNMFRLTSLCLIILFLGLTSASITHAETLNFVTKWGSFGSDNGQFNTPAGIAVDSSDNVYVVDSGNHRIQKFDSNDNYITEFNGSDFNGLGSIYVDSSNNIYADASNDGYIMKFDNKGNLVTKWNWNGNGNKSHFAYEGFVADSSGNVYVLENCFQIQKFDNNGKYLAEWDSENKYDHNYCGIAVDSSGNVYVTDGKNNQIKKFDGNGNLITTFKNPDANNGHYSPNEIAVDSSGKIYVTSKEDNEILYIYVLDSNGNLITKYGSSSGKFDGQFGSRIGIAVDSSGYLYVSDPGNNRIQKFCLTNNPTPTLSPIANFSCNVTEGNAPLSVQFTDLSQYAEGWEWNFGDRGSSNEQNPIHTYETIGTYNVNLKASNAQGTSKSQIVTIYVHQAVNLQNKNSQDNGLTDNTSATENVGQTPENSPNAVQNTTDANVAQTTEQAQSQVTSNNGSKKSPGFDIALDIVGLLAMCVIIKNWKN